MDSLIKTGFTTAAASQLKSFGDISVDIPTLDAIEGFIETTIKAELQRRKQIQIWKVQDLSGTNTTIQNVTPKALSDTMAICINDMGGANAGAIGNFIHQEMILLLLHLRKKCKQNLISKGIKCILN